MLNFEPATKEAFIGQEGQGRNIYGNLAIRQFLIFIHKMQGSFNQWKVLIYGLYIGLCYDRSITMSGNWRDFYCQCIQNSVHEPQIQRKSIWASIGYKNIPMSNVFWYGCEKQKIWHDQKYLTYRNTISQQNLTSLHMNTKGQSLNGEEAEYLLNILKTVHPYGKG